MKCHKCNINNATIHIEGLGEFCLECHNKMIVEAFGIQQLEEFSKEISIYDVDGMIHKFQITNLLMPMYSIWKAEEIDGGYAFEVMVDLDDEQISALNHLHQKILIGIGYKSLEILEGNQYISNALHREGKQYGLRTVGTGRIDVDLDTQKTVLMIDGKAISMDEFGLMLSSMEGFTFDYQMRDVTDEVLGKDMILRHFSINKKRLYESFETTLSWFLDDNILPQDREEACFEALFERIDDLELMFNYGDIQDAKELGRKMIARLVEVESDSDVFPNDLIEDIGRIIGDL
jgi:hypothetical protein